MHIVDILSKRIENVLELKCDGREDSSTFAEKKFLLIMKEKTGWSNNAVSVIVCIAMYSTAHK